MLLGLGSANPEAKLSGDFEVKAVGDSANGDGGVTHGALLARFAEQVHAGDELDSIRAEVIEAVGETGLVDAAAICANFNMMVRIADGTGTPLDEGSIAMSDDLRTELGLNDLTSRRLDEPDSTLAPEA